MNNHRLREANFKTHVEFASHTSELFGKLFQCVLDILWGICCTIHESSVICDVIRGEGIITCLISYWNGANCSKQTPILYYVQEQAHDGLFPFFIVPGLSPLWQARRRVLACRLI